MVRLLPDKPSEDCNEINRFQSHNGAIAADQVVGVKEVDDYAFQSHNGAIAAVEDGGVNYCQWSFNPTMVRLLHELQCVDNPPTLWFQSHNGAIAALDIPVGRPDWQGEFQSHNGAIAAQTDDQYFSA